MKPAAAVLAGVVVVHALIQALLVVGDPVPTASVSFAARVVASAVAVILAVWLTASAARDLVLRAGPGVIRRALDRSRVVVWVAGLLAPAVLLGILSPPAPLLVMVLGLLVVPAVVDGEPHPLRTAGARARNHPWRTASTAALVIVAAAVGWVTALLLGFFVTGVAGSALTFVVFGLLLAGLLVFAQRAA